MPIILTDLAKTLSEQTNIQVSIILEIWQNPTFYLFVMHL